MPTPAGRWSRAGCGCAGPLADTVPARIVEAGAETDEDGSVLLSRTVTIEGRSRAHVGGRSMPVAMLGEVGEQVVAVHGQSDQLRLLRPAEQRAALDRFAGAEHEKLLETYREAFTPVARGRGGSGRPAAQRRASAARRRSC